MLDNQMAKAHWGKNQLFIQKLPRICCLRNVNFVKNEALKNVNFVKNETLEM